MTKSIKALAAVAAVAVVALPAVGDAQSNAPSNTAGQPVDAPAKAPGWTTGRISQQAGALCLPWRSDAARKRQSSKIATFSPLTASNSNSASTERRLCRRMRVRKPAIGALQAIEAAGRQDEGIVITGIDANPQAREAIAAGGNFEASMAQDFHGIGKAAAEAVAQTLGGKPPKSSVIYVPTRLITAGNVED